MMKIYFLFLMIIIFLGTGCSIIKRKGSWGKKALWPISGSRVSTALSKNVQSPHVWVPFAGAGFIYLGGLDEEIVRWASKNNPIFGSPELASKYSDRIREVLYLEAGISALLTPSWDTSASNYLINKVKGATVTFFSFSLSEDFTNNIRKYVKRERPNGSNLRSLPSGHVTGSAAAQAVLRRNIPEIRMKDEWSRVINGVNTTLALGVAWSRVEGNRHYPTDVLIGYSIGNFLSGFIFDSFMNLDANEHLSIHPNDEKGLTLLYSLRY